MLASREAKAVGPNTIKRLRNPRLLLANGVAKAVEMTPSTRITLASRSAEVAEPEVAIHILRSLGVAKAVKATTTKRPRTTILASSAPEVVEVRTTTCPRSTPAAGVPRAVRRRVLLIGLAKKVELTTTERHRIILVREVPPTGMPCTRARSIQAPPGTCSEGSSGGH